MKSRVCMGIAVAGVLLFGAPLSAQNAGPEHWVGTWATAAVATPSQASGQPQNALAGRPPAINNQTLRQMVRTSIGGPRVRVVLTNAFGTRALPVGGVHVALR